MTADDIISAATKAAEEQSLHFIVGDLMRIGDTIDVTDVFSGIAESAALCREGERHFTLRTIPRIPLECVSTTVRLK
jgi:hypothetical protein